MGGEGSCRQPKKQGEPMFAKQDQSASVPLQGRIVVQDTLAVLLWGAAAVVWTLVSLGVIWSDSHDTRDDDFDCNKFVATTSREKAICGDSQSAELNESMSSAYRTARQVAGDEDPVVASQDQWEAATDRCADAECVAKAYHERISELKGASGGFLGSVGRSLFKLLLTGFALGVTYLLIQRIRVEVQGYVVDPEKDELSFPGGMISANSVSDYLKGSFIAQAFQRFTISLSDIQSLSAPTIHKVNHLRDGGRLEWNAHYIEIRGSFGAAKFRFFSEGKRDQLFAAIRQANQMGMPVFRSN